MEQPRIISVGFEGEHRAGKGTQIEMFAKKLEEAGIPFLVVKGSGTRANEGKSPGDPVSKWWSEALPSLKSGTATTQEWQMAADRLARELIIFRDRVLPNILKKADSKVAFLLIDRSILSITNWARKTEDKNLYPRKPGQKGPKIDANMVCPDIIINLVAEPEILLSRLDHNDPRYDFRAKNIKDNYEPYKKAIELIPEELRSRVINVDASMTPEEVQKEIFRILSEKVQGFNEIIKE